ncbi:primosomal protein N' [Haematospirillum sp. H1815]|uniref:primosomal protein N' n=1 Tax=Haematospirillum sp. H1815 TaxID=2723108 RepID=UPI00143B3563|nr:primosomal protein N' [Haematospirillum sp. H1815]NKD77382.1 primosomal protein N' [Haematospirillum sp. H1815]
MPESNPTPDIVLSPLSPRLPADDCGADDACFVAGSIVAVLLPLPVEGPYDYSVPSGMTLRPGIAVRVPLGRKMVCGIVWGPGAGMLDRARIRPVDAVLENAPYIPAVSRRFVEWVAAWTMASPGAVLKMVLPVADALEEGPVRSVWRWADDGPDHAEMPRMTPARLRVRDVMAGQAVPLSLSDMARLAGVSVSVVRGLADAGLLQAVADSVPADAMPDGTCAGPVLSPEQERAAARLVDAVGHGYRCTILEGVTGSGKTEVYFEAVASALRAGLQVLVLLPEITLTAQWLERFRVRFGALPSQWHSDLSSAVRRRTWRAVANGTASVIVGARSALFLPYAKLGLIVVDEEHEAAFKQEDGVVYHGRDMAVARAHLAGIPVILASATPSLETVINGRERRYDRVHLGSRHGAAVLPDVDILDVRRDRPEPGAWGPSWLAPTLVNALEQTLAAGEQALLFLNRRGYAPLTLCRTCGHRLQCPHCTAWLVEHRRHARLQCHHCGYYVARPDFCPSCEAPDDFAACGPGVERIAEEVAGRFPHARMALVASDTLSGPRAVASLVQQVQNRDVDILVGTQVLAKGLHFPFLTLVGVVDADLGLSGGDLRAAERTYQMLSQVAGRAGRSDRPGKVLLQTFQPSHPVLQALAGGDPAVFLEAEAEGRRLMGMPPFGRLAALIVSGPDASRVEQTARALARVAPSMPEVEVLGPAPAPMALLRGLHRWRLLLKAPRSVRIQPIVRSWLSRAPVSGRVRIQIDVDPYSFL